MKQYILIVLFILVFVAFSDSYASNKENYSPRIAVVSIEQINMRAKEFVPATAPFKNRLEKSLKDSGVFNVVSGELEDFSNTAAPDSKFTDYVLRIFISGFSDRIELDLWTYCSLETLSSPLSPFVAVHALRTTVKDASAILDAMDSLGNEVANTLQPKEKYQSKQIIFVEPFKSDEEAVKKTIQVMFCSELLATGRFILLDADCLEYKYNGHIYTIREFAQAPLETKRRICKQYYNLQWYIGGKIDPVGDIYQITTTGECPLRHIDEIKTNVPLGIQPEDIRISSNKAATVLLDALGESSKSHPIIFDEFMTTSPDDEPTIKHVKISSENGKVLNVDVILSVQEVKSEQLSPWQWGGDSISSKTFGYIMLKVDGKEIEKLLIDYTLFYGKHAKKKYTLSTNQYNLKLTISDILCDVFKYDKGAFGVNEMGTLNNFKARIILERE